MRILILGGGEVGTLVARRLIREKNEVVVVESDPERCAFLEDELDAVVVEGNASSIRVLQRAGLEHAAMLIAVTSNDEANMLACLIARAHSDVKTKVARLRTHEIDRWRTICGEQFLNIDLVIHPDREAADHIMRVVGYPGVADLMEFAEGRVLLFGMTVDEKSWVVGKSMAELDASGPPDNALIAMIFRSRRVIIPRGAERLRPGDHLYILAADEQLDATMTFMGLVGPKTLERVFILGGRQLGIEVALRLEKEGVHVKLFERKLSRCEKIASLVRNVVVVHGDGTDQRLLKEENIEGVDAYLALTGDDEDNLIASLMSKRLGARKAIALVNRLDFLPMAQLLGITSTISTRLAVVDRILQFVRKGHVLSVTTFRQEEAEAIELVASTGSRIVGNKLRDVHFPDGVVVGAIVRPGGEVLVPRGEAVISAGDRVIFFCLESVVPRLESAFFAGTRRGVL